jgi:hypothetical protein
LLCEFVNRDYPPVGCSTIRQGEKTLQEAAESLRMPARRAGEERDLSINSGSDAITGGPTEQTTAGDVPIGKMAGDQAPSGQRHAMHQGDELPASAPGAGENI